MKPTSIVFLDDLLRDTHLEARGFIYGCIEETLRQAFDVPVPKARMFPLRRGMSAGFSLEKFNSLCAADWLTLYACIPPSAADYLLAHLPPGALVVGYEMPPWLCNLLDTHGRVRVDIRMSPLRFARDLVFAVRSTTDGAGHIDKWSDEIEKKLRIDAGLMAASVQHNQPIKRHPERSVRVTYIGQTEKDAALIDDSGEIVRAERYADNLRDLIQDREITYAPHPMAGAFSKGERERLSRILGRKIKNERASLYSLLAGRQDVDFVAISSGAIQEASYFDRTATMLFRPICPIHKNFGDGRYRHATFSDVTNPVFWRALVGEHREYSGFDGPMPENLTRRLHNMWWGYADYMIDNDRFWQRVVTRSVKNIIHRALRT